MKTFLLLISASLACSGCVPQARQRVVAAHPDSAVTFAVPDPVASVTVSPKLLEFLDRLHAEFENEVSLCLTGRIGGDTLLISGFGANSLYNPPAPDSVASADCGAPTFSVARYHNHPSGTCGFSDNDLRRLFSDPWARASLVSCGGGRFVLLIKATIASLELVR